MRVFGYEPYCHIPKECHDKLATRSKKCIFFGYGKLGEMGFWLWDPESKKILWSNDVYFNEKKMHKKPIKIVEIRRVVSQEDGQVHNKQLENAPVTQERREEPQVVQPPMLRRSTWESKSLDRYVPSLDYVMLMDCKEPSCLQWSYVTWWQA